MNTTFISVVCADVTFAAPILHFTDLGEKKMETPDAYMVSSKEITKQECCVFFPLLQFTWNEKEN